MERVRISVLLLLVLCIVGAEGVDRSYELFKYCNTGTIININTASFLVVSEGQLTDDQCDVQVKSNWITGPGHDNEDWLMVLIEDLNMPCEGQTRLQFFNGSTDSNSTVSYPPQICTDNAYQAWYLIKNKTMGIRITAAPNRARYVRVKLLATATSFEKEQNIEDFVCDNHLRIVGSLKCDGDNNCGDFSDEMVDDCHYEYTQKAYRDLGLGLGLGLALFFFIMAVWCTVLSVCHFRRIPPPPAPAGAPAGAPPPPVGFWQKVRNYLLLC